MSRFFEFLRKVNGPVPGSDAESNSAELVSEASRILSVVNGGSLKESCSTPLIHEVSSLSVSIGPSARLVFHTDATSPAADRFRLLRMRLRAIKNTDKLKRVLLTSPLPGDGKS